MTSDKHDKLFSSSPPIPEFLRRQTPGPRDEQIADLTAKLAEAERERDSATFDKALTLLDASVDIEMKARARLAASERASERRCETAMGFARQIQELRDEVARLTLEATVGEAQVKDSLASMLKQQDYRVKAEQARESAEAQLRGLREWITAAHHLPLCKKWSYALDDQMQIVPALVHDVECTCGRDSILAKSGEP